MGKGEDRLARVPARVHTSPLPLLDNFPLPICLANSYSSFKTQLVSPSSVQCWLLSSSSEASSIECCLFWWHHIHEAIGSFLSPSGSVWGHTGGWHRNFNGRSCSEELPKCWLN